MCQVIVHVQNFNQLARRKSDSHIRVRSHAFERVPVIFDSNKIEFADIFDCVVFRIIRHDNLEILEGLNPQRIKTFLEKIISILHLVSRNGDRKWRSHVIRLNFLINLFGKPLANFISESVLFS